MLNIAHPTQTVPAMQGCIGSRLVTYSTQLPVAAIEPLLGHDPRSRLWKRLPDDLEEIYRQLQRATKPERLHSLKNYIRTRFREDAATLGAFPAISIGVQEHLRVIDIDPERAPGAVLLNIDLATRNRRILIDGLGRVSAGLDLQELSYSHELPEHERAELRKLIQGFTFQAVIYAPAPGTRSLSIDELGQLFADFNFRVAPVPQHIAISLDRSDIYIQITERLAATSIAIAGAGGMEKRAASLGKHSAGIVAQQVLLRFVRGACEGETAQESNSFFPGNSNLHQHKIDDVIERLAAFLDAFADEMGANFADRNFLHLSSAGWQALGIIFHDVTDRLNGTDPMKVARALGRLDWRRSGELWTGVVAEKLLANGDKELVIRQAGASARREVVRVLRNHLGIDKRLAELAQAA